jgi:hypothetical protein
MLFYVWCCTAMIDKDMMVLQNYTNSENGLVGPHGDMYPASHDASHAMNIKAEEMPDAKRKTFLCQKLGCTVCLCMSTVRQISYICRNVNCLSDLHLSFCLHICLSVPRNHIHYVACDVPLPFYFKQV